MSSSSSQDENRSGMSSALRRNIEAIQERRAEELRNAPMRERIALAITSFTGSMRFVYLHLVIFGGWIIVNIGIVPGIPRFDPEFVKLAMAASVEAIFLSTFVLISQNRMAAAADKRADLDLQINLLAEHELTKLAEIVSAIADKVQAQTADNQELNEVKRDIQPERVLDEIEAKQNGPVPE